MATKEEKCKGICCSLKRICFNFCFPNTAFCQVDTDISFRKRKRRSEFRRNGKIVFNQAYDPSFAVTLIYVSCQIQVNNRGWQKGQYPKISKALAKTKKFVTGRSGMMRRELLWTA